MQTQPIYRESSTTLRGKVPALLIGVAALFIISGTFSLYLTAPRSDLTSFHLFALVGGWGAAWGGTFVLLNRLRPEIDPFIVPVAALLTGWGLLLLARLAPGFLLRQIVWLLLGCATLCGIVLLPALPRLLRRYRYTLLVGGLLLLGITLVFGVNPSGYGQRLWLGFPLGEERIGIYFQPSELLKLLLVIYLASYLSDRRDAPREHPKGWMIWLAVLGPMLTMVGLAILLLGWQQDLGAALLFYLTSLAMLYLAWGKKWHVLLGLLLFVPVAVLGYAISARVALRVSIWLDPWAPEQADRAYQILQSIYALAAGGIVGQGLGQGLPTFIPAVHTDFVYAALVEEFGMIGGVALIILLGLVVYRGLHLAQHAEAPFESLLAGGIAALIGVQTWVIVGGNAKLIPITGVTLPFLSYGGSSMITTLIMTGLLLNISTPHPAPLTLSIKDDEAPPIRRTAGRLGQALLLLLTVTVLSTGTWTILRTAEIRTYATNPRQILGESRIRRGRILDRRGRPLARIEIDAQGYVTRTYPSPESAPVIGYATLHYGTTAIEEACNARLRGEIGRTSLDDVWAGLLHRAPRGQDVRLTLDADLQKAAHDLLEGHQGAAILIDAHTGEILAMASSPTYDPATVAENWEALREDPDAPLLNRATQAPAQPGAILETVLLATALARDALPPPAEPFTAAVSINGTTVRCAAPPIAATWEAALTAQCAAPFKTLAHELGAEALARSFRRWGLTQPLPLEIPVAVPPPPDLKELEREALGQGDMLVTPLHIASVAATLGNDGLRPPLHLLSEPLEGCVSPTQQAPVRVVSTAVAKEVRELWPQYGDAIGHRGRALAGPDRTLMWFMGLNSSQAPRYAVAVMVQNPNEEQTVVEIATALLRQAVGP